MAVVAIRDLLEAGVHFGHQTRKWHPKMAPFIFDERNGIHIVDLQKTQKFLDFATQFVRNVAQRGGTILFVGTKRQIRDIIGEEAQGCSMPYVSERWLGGMLTNMTTIRGSIGRLEEIEALERDGTIERLPKKEQSSLRRELVKLHRNLDGVRTLERAPDVVFIVDIMREELAIKEARKVGATVVAIVDTNCNPEPVDFVIPGNDDAISSVRLIANVISRAVKEGVQFYREDQKQYKERVQEEREKRRGVKSTARKPRSEEARQLQERLTAKAEASAAPDEDVTVQDVAAPTESETSAS
jgi:small subunit ribosomal protein S2